MLRPPSAIARARQLPSPGTPGEGRVRVTWRTRCARVANTWFSKSPEHLVVVSPEHLVLEITLTPALSRSTGRGSTGPARDTCDLPGRPPVALSSARCVTHFDPLVKPVPDRKSAADAAVPEDPESRWPALVAVL